MAADLFGVYNNQINIKRLVVFEIVVTSLGGVIGPKSL
jgi:hypothetical protein